MGPNLEMQGRSKAIMNSSTNKDNETIVKPTEVNHMVCTSNYEDNTFEMGTLLGEQNKVADESEDVEIILVDSKNSDFNTPVQSQSPHRTECSSSFGDTMSGAEIGNNGSDAEVVSEFNGNNASALENEECNDLLRLRRKRLTPHWRTFIQPFMWRAKWAELQIKKLYSQASKYDKILAENKKRKQHKLDSFAPGLSAKSLHYTYDGQRGKIMKRNKRKRSEDMIDTALSNHTLFSYFGTKRSITNAASNGPDWEQPDAKPDENEEFGPTNGLSSLDYRDDSNSWEHLLEKVCVAQSKVGDLKDRLQKVTSENAGKILQFTNKSSLLGPQNNILTGSIPNPTSPPNNGDRMGVVGCSSIVSQLLQEYNNMGKSAASSHEEMTAFPDIIESMDQPPVGGSWRSTGDGFLIHNTRANEELNSLGEVKIHPLDKKLKASQKELGAMPPPPMVAQEHLNTDNQPTPKIQSISKITSPNNKNKRTKRKARAGQWSRRSSG